MKKQSVYEMVTERIISQLEQGIIPWEKPWSGARSGAYNRITKKPYSLLNQLLLKHDGEYATFAQWKNLGGKIRKLLHFGKYYLLKKKRQTEQKKKS